MTQKHTTSWKLQSHVLLSFFFSFDLHHDYDVKIRKEVPDNVLNQRGLISFFVKNFALAVQAFKHERL